MAQESDVATEELDPWAALQYEAIAQRHASWGHWGTDPSKYSNWTTHSNRLVPIYTFGGNLDAVTGKKSLYRSKEAVQRIYGRLPVDTVNPNAEYADQTDVMELQRSAVARGKKRVLLFIVDGMDWQTTWAAAIAKQGVVAYESGRGTGLAFLDYDQTETDFGSFVSSPHNNGTNVDVNKQIVTNPGGKTPGGYSVELAGERPWAKPKDAEYLLGRGKQLKHAYTDSAASATSMTSGIKTYNNAINVDPSGREVLPIARLLQLDGFAVGVVTSVPISHATPACAYANNVHRGDYQDLTRDLLGLPSVFHPGGLAGVDVLIGAGWGADKESDGGQGENYVPGNRYLADADRQAIDVVNGGEYVVAERTSGRLGTEVLSMGVQRAIAEEKRLFGYFGVGSGHLPFQTADGGYDPVHSIGNPRPAPAESYSANDVQENPTLADMTEAAMNVLQAKSDRWWMMVESGDVDWANHANNIDNSIGAVLSAESAFHRAVRWIESNGGWEDTLLILTADHGHYLEILQPEVLAGN